MDKPKKPKYMNKTFTEIKVLEREQNEEKKQNARNELLRDYSKSKFLKRASQIPVIGSPDKLVSPAPKSINLSGETETKDMRGLPFDENNKYVINSMEVYTFKSQPGKLLLVMLPIKDLKKINKTYVLENSKMLLKHFNKKNSEMSDNSFGLFSNRSILKKSRVDQMKNFKSTRTHLEMVRKDLGGEVTVNQKQNPFLVNVNLNMINEGKVEGSVSKDEGSVILNNNKKDGYQNGELLK